MIGHTVLHTRKYLGLSAALAFGCVLPIVGSFLLNGLAPDWRWEHHPVHAVTEGLGAFAALSLAALILVLRRFDRIAPFYIWVASALTGMGVLDLFHAATHAGQTFVWLHSAAPLVGGSLFACVWFPERVTTSKPAQALPMAILVCTTLGAVISIAAPDAVPSMADEVGFTFTARSMNILGGVGFLAAALRFALRAESGDALLFTNHCLLFGVASLLFEFSVLWDGTWWLWHVLRLIAYGIALYFFFALTRRSEVELRKNEARYRSVFDNSAIGMVLTGPNGRFQQVNPAMCDMFGYSEQEFLSMSVENLTHSEDRSGTRGVIKRLWSGDSGSVSMEKRYVHKDGREIWGVVTVSPVFAADGAVVFLTAQLQDITERKRAEEVLREKEQTVQSVVEHTDTGFVVVDGMGLVLEANEPYCRLVGVDGPSEIMGCSVLEWTAPESVEENTRAVEKCAREGSITDFETTYLRKDGSRVHILINATTENTENGPRLIALCRDITERKAIEKQLRQSQKMEAVGQLSGGIAHDFNNILAVMLSNLQLLQDDLQTGTRGVGEEDETIEILGETISAGKRAAQLTERLLAFSRRQSLRPVATDANELVQGMLKILSRTLGENIAIELIPEPTLPPVNIDPLALEQAFLNLAVNARMAMPTGGKLSIATKARQLAACARRAGDLSPGTYVEIAFADTGCGMSPEVREHALEPFFTTREVGQGSGLGLSMIYGFARQSGGRVEIESEVDTGTTVRLLLPVTSAASVTTTETHEQDTNQTGTGTVLVVEDDADVRRSVVRVIKRLGYTTLEAADGPAALEVLRHNEGIDLLFSDVVMPEGMSGIELGQQAVGFHVGLKVLLTSGYSAEELARADSTDHNFELLKKPYSNEELAVALSTAVNGSGESGT